MKDRALVVGISGGSCSGKTSIAQALQTCLKEKSAIISQDNYYHDFSKYSEKQNHPINFDLPEMIDFDLIISHIIKARNGSPIEQPVYNFIDHRRTDKVTLTYTSTILLVEGLHILLNEKLRNLLDISIYLDVPEGVRKSRRLDRDSAQRGRSFHAIEKQFIDQVLPMHKMYIEPQKEYGDIILVNEESDMSGNVELLLEKIKHMQKLKING